MCPTPVDGLRGGGRDHINLKTEFGLFTHHAQNWALNMPLMLTDKQIRTKTYIRFNSLKTMLLLAGINRENYYSKEPNQQKFMLVG